MPHQASERWTSRVRPGKRRSITIVLRCSVRITSARSARRSNAVTSKLTGDGRTIVRGSFGRFSAGVLTGESAGFHPAVTPIRTDAFDPSTFADIAPGKKVDISVWRDGKSQNVSVEIGTLAGEQIQASATPDEAAPAEENSEQALADLGISVTPGDDGLTVSTVDPDSDASDRGLKEGDRITSVNNQTVKSADDVMKVIEGARKDGRTKALFQIETKDGSRFLALPIDQG